MTVYRYVRSGRLPARQTDGEWQVLVADLADFAARRRKPAAAPRAKRG